MSIKKKIKRKDAFYFRELGKEKIQKEIYKYK